MIWLGKEVGPFKTLSVKDFEETLKKVMLEFNTNYSIAVDYSSLNDVSSNAWIPF